MRYKQAYRRWKNAYHDGIGRWLKKWRDGRTCRGKIIHLPENITVHVHGFCPMCNQKQPISMVHGGAVINGRGKAFNVGDSYWMCDTCGDMWYDSENTIDPLEQALTPTPYS